MNPQIHIIVVVSSFLCFNSSLTRLGPYNLREPDTKEFSSQSPAGSKAQNSCSDPGGKAVTAISILSAQSLETNTLLCEQYFRGKNVLQMLEPLYQPEGTCFLTSFLTSFLSL